MKIRSLLVAALLCIAAFALPAAPTLELKPSDHVALIGNALADRMQHHGWLETLVHAKFPKHDLVFRNLAAAGDEVAGFTDKPDGKVRMRSENFGTSDDWLKKVQADVVLAFFGYNESFAGDAGLDKFKTDLGAFIRHTRSQNYSGKGNARLVIFSPIAAEPSNDPNLSKAEPINANLQKYAAAMAEVAKANSTPFVDLYYPSLELYSQAAKKKQSLTFNTVHLTEAGDQALAPVAFRALFGEAAPDTAKLEKLRAAVLDKNHEWHRRYRTVDGFNVYGGRSGLAFTPGKGGFKQGNKEPEAPYLSNYQTMQDEMKQRDVKTTNRDQRIWAVAKGGDLAVKDDNLPRVRLLESSNKPDVKPFLSGEESIKHITVAKGLKVTLFADEKQFPELASPVQMAFDTKGRLWVAAWPSYPELRPTDKVFDKLLIFEDTNNDGKADKCTTFLDGLNCPTGFQLYKDGVIVVQAPDVWFVRDTNGDGKADWKERVMMGLDSADSHHTANAMNWSPGGENFLSDGVFHRTQLETAYGPVRNSDGCIYRWEPLTHKLERYVPYGFANPHGKVFDRWGNDIITDATGNANYFGPAFTGFISEPAKHANMKQFWNRPSRPCPGTSMLSSRHFPDEFQGNFLNLNVIGFQGIFRVKMSEDGAGLKGETLEDLVKGDNNMIPNFRPAAAEVAPDGSIYFVDWAKELIGHMQHHIRDPNRDKTHGRIYRITAEGRPLLKPVKIDGETIENLLAALTTPEDNVRIRAKIELSKHDSTKVIAATKKWAAGLDKADKEYQHHLTEALWVHQWNNVVDEALLKQMLRSTDHRARAAATRVLCYWRDRVKDPLKLLAVQAKDDHARVRLEAIRACSFFTTSAAAEVALSALEKEANPDKPDYYIKYCLDETMKQLGKFK